MPEAEPEAEWTVDELDEVEEREPPAGGDCPTRVPTIAHLIGVVAARVERPGRDEADEAHDGRWRDRGRADRRRGRARRRGERDTRPGPRDRDRGPRRGPTRGPEPNCEEETQVWGELHVAETEVQDALLIDDYAAHPAAEPVIGPQFAAARRRLALSVDELADRTRIRPHVIEAIEVDDFSACGGDFYARGHLRTLARVLGVDVRARCWRRTTSSYADAPIDPRRVFEAELAGAGLDPRHPRRPELVGAGRGRDGPDPVLVGRAPGDRWSRPRLPTGPC